MVLPSLLLLIAAAIAVLFLYFRRRPDHRSLSRRILILGVGLGILRASLASFGWYVVEHTGGPFQVPAFALALLAWPEGALVSERRLTPAPFDFYVRLCILLVASTLAIVALVAFAASRRRNEQT